MRINRTTQLLAAAVLGVALAGVGVAGPAMADDDPEEGIDVTVTIEPSTTHGQVSMTVADNGGVPLQEDGSNAAARQFVGTLPTVTVTDTRRPRRSPPATSGRSSARPASSPRRAGPRRPSARSTWAGGHAC
ncbi:hypothetical protein ACFQ0B_49670 [Nonomuraea thailandensis]